MSETYEEYTRPPALPWQPRCVGYMRQLIAEYDGVAPAMAELFRRAGVGVSFEGDTRTWDTPGRGVLAIGNHVTGTESATVVAAFGELGRDDLHFVGKPIAAQARLIAALGDKAAAMLLPAFPRSLAGDRPNRLDRDLAWRLTHRRRLPPLAAIEHINQRTLDSCARLLTAGQAVVLYPAGGVVDAVKRPWHQGAGKIIGRLDATTRRETTVLPFAMAGFSSWRLGRSLLGHCYGWPAQPWQTTIQIGQQGSITELLGEDPPADPRAATEILRQQYIAYFDGAAGHH